MFEVYYRHSYYDYKVKVYSVRHDPSYSTTLETYFLIYVNGEWEWVPCHDCTPCEE